MQKYIVEAPELKDGQKASSGGIRENGKIKAQFSNPIPYNEDTAVAVQPAPQRARRTELGNILGDAFVRLLTSAFDEYIVPVASAKLHQLASEKISLLLGDRPSVPGIKAHQNIIEIEPSSIRDESQNVM